MSRQRIIILTMALLGLISVFLPWNESSRAVIVERSSGEGWIAAVLFIVCFILSAAGNRNSNIRGGQYAFLLVVSLLILLFSAYKVYEITAYSRTGSSFINLFGITSVGFGLYLIIFIGIAIPITGISWQRTGSKRRRKHKHRPHRESGSK